MRIKSGFGGAGDSSSDQMNHAGSGYGGAHRNPSQQRPHSMDAATLLAASTEDVSHQAVHSAALYGDVVGGHSSLHLEPFHPHHHNPPSRPQSLNQETTRHLMTSFLWVVKNMDQSILRSWWSEYSNRLDSLIDVLELCVSNFEYKGRKEMRRKCTKRTGDRKRQLEQMIAGAGTARMELLRRRAGGGTGAGSSSPGNAAGAETGTRFDRNTCFKVTPILSRTGESPQIFRSS